LGTVRGTNGNAEADVSGPRDEAPGREAWRLIAEMLFSDESQARFQDACAIANLSPPLLKALLTLDSHASEPMRVLAKGWGCDASWVTGIVDGLEERGYVERRVLPRDRRVKVVQLTPAGEAAKAKVLERLHEPPAAITALAPDEQVALRDLLRKVACPVVH
jgi:DNA-binding MarR family transcriptional regulator